MQTEERIQGGCSEESQRSVLRKQVVQHRSSLESYLKMVHFLTVHEMAHTTKFKRQCRLHQLPIPERDGAEPVGCPGGRHTASSCKEPIPSPYHWRVCRHRNHGGAGGLRLFPGRSHSRCQDPVPGHHWPARPEVRDDRESHPGQPGWERDPPPESHLPRNRWSCQHDGKEEWTSLPAQGEESLPDWTSLLGPQTQPGIFTGSWEGPLPEKDEDHPVAALRALQWQLCPPSCVRLTEIQKILGDPPAPTEERCRHRVALSRRSCQHHPPHHAFPDHQLGERGFRERRRHCCWPSNYLFVKAFHFQAAIHHLSDVLPVLTSLSKVLQGEKLDFITVQPFVNGAVSTLQQMRDNPGLHMQKLTDDLSRLAEFGVKGDPTGSRLADFKKDVSNKYLDNLINNIQSRFKDVEILQAYNMFDPEQLNIFMQQYAQGEEPIIQEEQCRQEWPLFRNMLASNFRHLTARQVLRHLAKETSIQDGFPELCKLAAIGLALPMTTADEERCFSTMN